MAGHFRGLQFPSHPQFSGFMKPCRFEGEVQNLEVIGFIPPELDGTFYRVMPDPQLPPLNDNDPVGFRRPVKTLSMIFQLMHLL